MGAGNVGATFRLNTFTSNTAKVAGGAVYFASNSNLVSFQTCTFTSNQVSRLDFLQTYLGQASKQAVVAHCRQAPKCCKTAIRSVGSLQAFPAACWLHSLLHTCVFTWGFTCDQPGSARGSTSPLYLPRSWRTTQ
jgi:predicted outer membrane repeat protein